jgi:hypothetical protein
MPSINANYSPAPVGGLLVGMMTAVGHRKSATILTRLALPLHGAGEMVVSTSQTADDQVLGAIALG